MLPKQPPRFSPPPGLTSVDLPVEYSAVEPLAEPPEVVEVLVDALDDHVGQGAQSL